MKLTRKATNETVSLEDGFLFSDEFDWAPIKQNSEYAVDGTFIVQTGKMKSGRPITLLAKDTSQGWIQRKDLSKLYQWSQLQGERFVLQFEHTHDNQAFNVIFNHEQKAFEASPVLGAPTLSDDDNYNATMRFLEFNA